jgi:hypothetical protein
MRNLTTIMYTSVFILAYSAFLYQQYVKDTAEAKTIQQHPTSTEVRQSEITSRVPVLSSHQSSSATVRNGPGFSEIEDNRTDSTSS